MLPTLSHDGYPGAEGPDDAPARLRLRECVVGVGKSMMPFEDVELCRAVGGKEEGKLCWKCQSKQVHQ